MNQPSLQHRLAAVLILKQELKLWLKIPNL